MATLYVTEFQNILDDRIQIAEEPELASQTVAIGASAEKPTNPFSDATRFVRLHTDAICSVLFGVSPVATATNRRLAANQTEYFAVPMGQKYTVSVITNT